MLDARRPDDQSGASFPAPLLESMTSSDLTILEPEVCPYLGLPDDPRTRFTFADPAHRCHVGAKPIPIDLGHQGAYCLTTGYPACKRFRSPKTAGGPASGPARSFSATIVAGAVVPVATAAADATVSRDGGTSRGRSRALRRAAALLAVLALVMLMGAIRAGVIGGSPAGGGAPGVVASPAAAETPAPTTVTSASTATPTAGLRSTSATTAPTATPVPTGTPRSVSVIHVVVRGETLSSIAARYGVTAKAIQDANKIVDPSLILAGDRLVIPPPP
jgi:LysM repeat protein